MNQSKYIPQRRFAPRITSRHLRLRDYTNVAYMADIVNLASAAALDSVFNTGVPLADIAKKKIRGIVLLDSGVNFTGSAVNSVAGFLAELKAKCIAAKGSRAYPIWDLLNFEDNTGDPSTGSIGNLTTATIVTSNAVPSFRFGYNGTESRHAKMSAMNSMSLDVIFVDEGFTFFGTAAANGGFGGYSVLQAYADVTKFIVSDAVNQYAFRVTLGDISQYRENSRYIVANSGALAAVGLINVEFETVSEADNVFTLQPISEGGTNIQPLYETDLAALTFTAKNLETGDAVTVTSVADDNAQDALVITLDATEWGALSAGDRVQISGPSASAMSAAGIKPYEFVPFIVTKS